MKNKQLIYAVAAVLGLSATACSDSFLEMHQDGIYDQLDSETKINWYVNTLYNTLWGGFTEPNKTLVYKPGVRDKCTEEAWGAKDEIKVDSRKNLFTLDDLGSDASKGFYAGYFGTKLEAGKKSPDSGWHQIRNCNLGLEQLELYKDKFSDEFYRQAKGQLYYMRAVQMFDMVRIFGPIPIVTTVISSEANGDKYPRESVSKCIQQIANDLTLAASLLPDVWADAENNYGRITKGAALALKSRVLLTYASPVFNKNWNDPSDKRWALALQAAQEAVNNMPNKSLEGIASSADWAAMLCNSAKTTDNTEAIFVRLLAGTNSPNAANNGWENSLRIKSQGGGGGQDVPLELMDAFPKADGTLLQEGERAADRNIGFIANRDPRFYRTFAFSGMVWGYNQQKNDTVWAYRYIKNAIPDASVEGGYKISYTYSEENDIASPVFVRKMSDPNANYEDKENAFKYSGVNINEYRYAELALNLAECHAATGRVDACKEVLGRLRARVGIPQGSNYYGLNTYVTDRASAISACLRERLIELCYEGKRCWDTWRWLLYDGGQGFAGNGEVMNLSQTNTCTYLGVTPLNGTSRTSLYLAAKQNPDDISGIDGIPTPDPLLEKRQLVGVDPDSPDFQSQLTNLVEFWKANFEFAEPTEPADKGDNGEVLTLGWKANYYISGINKEALTKNPWLGQTIGWQNTDGSMGTVSFQDDEEITIDWLQ